MTVVSSARAISVNAARTASCSARLCRRLDLASWLGTERLNQPICARPSGKSQLKRIIARLHGFESGWDEEKVGDARAALRREKFARPLRWLRLVATGLARKALPQSQLGKACSCLLNHWEVLVAHQEHAFTRIDNNLVENAIRHSPPEGHISIGGLSAGSVVQIWVDDEGLGIPEDEREVVFDAFYRSPESRASKGDGSGLGLAIARAIAIGHGGSLRVLDAPSGGARLQLELPARRVR